MYGHVIGPPTKKPLLGLVVEIIIEETEKRVLHMYVD
jgi:hypothetical protein